MRTMILSELQSHRETIQKVIDTLTNEIEEACQMVIETLKSGNKVLFCGNGGSAADAQHLAAELSGRYKKERNGLPGLALTTDTSALTSIANDYAFEEVFARQIKALAKKGDLIVGISTSGNSENVIRAFKAGKALGCKTLGLTGNNGGRFIGQCDLNVIVPSADTPRIQETHIVIGHIICQAVDDAF